MRSARSFHCCVPNTRCVTRVTTATPLTWSIFASTRRAPIARTIHPSTSPSGHDNAFATCAYVTSPPSTATLVSASPHNARSFIFPAHSASSMLSCLNSVPFFFANAANASIPSDASSVVRSSSTAADFVSLSARTAAYPKMSHRNIISFAVMNETTAAVATSSPAASRASPCTNVFKYFKRSSKTRVAALPLGSTTPCVSESMVMISPRSTRVACGSSPQSR
mmetsp:Transcript_7086/g.23733  ORF Transcript_7086/g.23733 Transcript_7086/m.23733 type:complete len:223 (-) Transcript_7086:623-1291(-)